MSQPARRKTNPNLRVSGSGPADRPPPPQDHPHEVEAAWTEPPEGTDCVVCFLSGRRVLRKEAVQVRLGPGRSMWMSERLVSEADRRR